MYSRDAVTVPDGVHGEVEVRRYEITPERSALSSVGSSHRGGIPPGTYVGLFRRGALWMTDSPIEKTDLRPFLHKMRAMEVQRVLVNGLGLGMVVHALLGMGHVRHVDVVEIDPSVIALVGPHYRQMAADCGKTIDIRQADAFTVQWPVGTRWDGAWHDVWRDLCLDNLKPITTLHRRYGGRVAHQDSWGRGWLIDRRRREQRQDRFRRAFAPRLS